MGKIVVTGGAGYIGCHIVRLLTERGLDVVVVDDLSNGHRQALGDAPLVLGDFADPAVLERLFAAGDVEFIIHMAALCEVGESIEDPARYYANNVTASLGLLDAARGHGVRGVVFSSSAAVYGEPESVPIEEHHPLRPTNPYGDTKLAVERALAWYNAAYGSSYVALRYFNAAGAHPDGTLGEDHENESHLIPRLLTAVRDAGPEIPILGQDYPTRDGTCLRDYVHVVDLAEAHLSALELMRSEPGVGASFNLGNGEGFTVLEVVDAVERVTGTRPPIRMADRRPGDPATLVAASALARRRLGWQPSVVDLDEIVRTAWRWHDDRPGGYDDEGRSP